MNYRSSVFFEQSKMKTNDAVDKRPKHSANNLADKHDIAHVWQSLCSSLKMLVFDFCGPVTVRNVTEMNDMIEVFPLAQLAIKFLCKFKSLFWLRILSLLQSDVRIVDLILNDCEIGDDNVQNLVFAMKNSPCLKTLNLSSNCIGAEGVYSLVQHLNGSSSKIESLRLDGNDIGDNGARYLADSLAQNCKLKELFLARNNIKLLGGKCLGESLCSNTTLTKLYLFGNAIGDSGVLSFAMGLRMNKSLRALNLKHNQISSDGARYIVDALESNLESKLDTLLLFYNAISDPGAGHFARLLKTNKTLTRLDLGDNMIKHNGVGHLSESLRENDTLTELRLDYNQLGYDGAVSLGCMLTFNNRLTSLSLNSTEICPGIMSLLHGIHQNTSLSVLSLNDNGIGDVSNLIVDFRDISKEIDLRELEEEDLKLSKLSKLSLCSNDITQDCIPLLIRLLNANPNIKQLKLEDNPLGSSGVTTLVTKLKHNQKIIH